MVQVEFYGEEKIQAAYKRYLGILLGPFPKPGDADASRLFQAKDDAFYDFVHEIDAEPELCQWPLHHSESGVSVAPFKDAVLINAQH